MSHKDWTPDRVKKRQILVDDVCDMVMYKYIRPVVEDVIRMVKGDV